MHRLQCTKGLKGRKIRGLKGDIRINDLPRMNGLVLAGGKSRRMGIDKGALHYHNKPHREYTADLINEVCDESFISCRKDQLDSFHSQHQVIVDGYSNLGPFGGMLSAFESNPHCAWMIVACDFPHLDAASIRQLAEERDPNKVATCFHNPNKNFPEPLITIWEPKALPIFQNFLNQGYYSPKSILVNTNVKEIQIDNKLCLESVNERKQYDLIVKSFQSK